jgi:hypothetical protein
VLVSNTAGTVASRVASLTVLGQPSAPVFASQPVSQAVVAGDSLTFSVSATGSPAPSLQWRKNGTNLSGANSSTLHLNSVTTDDQGVYDAIASNQAGQATSSGASLVVQAPYVAPPAPPPTTSPIAGVELRANYTVSVEVGGKRTVGFLIRGDVPKKILVRALGPTLSALGNWGAMADPLLELVSGWNVIARNDNWGGDSGLLQVSAQAGATPFVSADSRDAALVLTVPPGAYSAVVSSAEGLGGTVLVEVYEFP